MVVQHALAVIPSADLDRAREWWSQVPGAQTEPSGQFRIATLSDPDGNSVVIAQVVA